MDKKKLKNPSTIRLQPEIKVWVLRLAYDEKRTLSNMINKLLDDCKKQKEST